MCMRLLVFSLKKIDETKEENKAIEWVMKLIGSSSAEMALCAHNPPKEQASRAAFFFCLVHSLSPRRPTQLFVFFGFSSHSQENKSWSVVGPLACRAALELLGAAFASSIPLPFID